MAKTCSDCGNKIGLLDKHYDISPGIIYCKPCNEKFQEKIKKQKFEYIKKYIDKYDVEFLVLICELIPYWIDKINEYDSKKEKLHSNYSDDILVKGSLKQYNFMVNSFEMDNFIDSQAQQMGQERSLFPKSGFEIIRNCFNTDIAELESISKKQYKDISIEDRKKKIDECKKTVEFLEDADKFLKYLEMKNLVYKYNHKDLFKDIYGIITPICKDKVPIKKVQSDEDKLKELEKDLFEKKKQNPLNIDFDNINGFEFEDHLNKLFTKLGYSVLQTPKSGDQGADLILEKDGVKTVVQAKRYSGTVSNSAVQEIVASKKFYNADKAIVVTTGVFTKSAIELAYANDVELWDKKKLDEVMGRG